MNRQYLFTSESVSEGHPDKVADQISDAILDAYLAQDPHARVACETLIKNDTAVLAGEVTADAVVDHQAVARAVLERIGYTSSEVGFNGHDCCVISLLSQQPAQIEEGANHGTIQTQGASDQGLMFGYACTETPALMPAPITYAHGIVQALARLRHDGLVDWLRPDAKSQVTVRYEAGKAVAVDTIVVSTQHAPSVPQAEIERAVRELAIEQVIPSRLLAPSSRVLVNPTGTFEIGGPTAEVGLTGRKIMVDTYGGMAHHGGGAFSGKDPSKGDRSAAYAARHVAVNVVASGLADRCEVQISYAIGIAEPTSVYVDTFGTGRLSDDAIERIVFDTFDLRPSAIICALELARPIFEPTAAYGHFGRRDLDLPWERQNRVDALRTAARALDQQVALRLDEHPTDDDIYADARERAEQRRHLAKDGLGAFLKRVEQHERRASERLNRKDGSK